VVAVPMALSFCSARKMIFQLDMLFDLLVEQVRLFSTDVLLYVMSCMPSLSSSFFAFDFPP
jgi:hypothetical protein